MQISFSPPQFESIVIHLQYSAWGMPNIISVYFWGSLLIPLAIADLRLRAADSPCSRCDTCKTVFAGLLHNLVPSLCVCCRYVRWHISKEATHTYTHTHIYIYLGGITTQIWNGIKQTMVVLCYRNSDHFEVQRLYVTRSGRERASAKVSSFSASGSSQVACHMMHIH